MRSSWPPGATPTRPSPARSGTPTGALSLASGARPWMRAWPTKGTARRQVPREEVEAVPHQQAGHDLAHDLPSLWLLDILERDPAAPVIEGLLTAPPERHRPIRLAILGALLGGASDALGLDPALVLVHLAQGARQYAAVGRVEVEVRTLTAAMTIAAFGGAPDRGPARWRFATAERSCRPQPGRPLASTCAMSAA